MPYQAPEDRAAHREADRRLANASGDGLSEFDDAYNAAPVQPPGSFGAIPDGDYQTRIRKVELKYADKAPYNAYLRWELEILGPNHAKRRLWTNSFFHHGPAEDPEKHRKRTKTMLSLCNVTCPPSQVEAHLGELVGLTVECNKWTKPNAADPSKDYFINFNRRIVVNTGPMADVASPTQAPPIDEDAPPYTPPPPIDTSEVKEDDVPF